MKTLTIVLIALFTCGIFAQEVNVPENVKTKLNSLFPKATDVEWDLEDSNVWEAEFTSEGKNYSVSIDNTGKWLETESSMEKENLPPEVFKSLSLEFEGFEIESVESIMRPEFEGFELLLEKEDTSVEVLATKSGKLTIKKVALEDEDDDEGKDEKEDNERDEE
ncbi:MAG: PepSY-like domain-containing protein [Melioribacteraceae bacterium]|nr:PepSY-like domain-containing protein [Melioribacteraceae bacterium]